MRLRAATLAVLGAAVLGAAVAAHGKTLTVSNTNDAGTGSLRQAVIDANDSADATNTITFSLPAGSTIALLSPLESLHQSAAGGTLIFDAMASPGLSIHGGESGSAVQPFLTNCETVGTQDECIINKSVSFRNLSYADGFIVFGGSTLTLDESGNGVIDGDLFADEVMSDDGVFHPFTLIKTGTGTTTLNAGRVIALFALNSTSAVRIEQGTFVVNGDLFSDAVEVNSQTTLVVNGTLSADTLLIASPATLAGNSSLAAISADTTVQGRLAPSGTAGVLGFDGPLRFESTSVLDVDVQSGGGDLVDVTGGAVTLVSGARLVFRANPSDFQTAESVTVLSADSPISGSFTLVSNDYAFLDTALDLSDPNRVQIEFSPNGLSFSSFASTPNQQAVAQLLESASVGASGDLADAFAAIGNSTASEVPILLDAIGGESLTAFATARQILGERTARALQRRARDPAWGNGRAIYLSEDPDVAAQGDERPLIDRVRAGTWLDALGTFGELEGDRGEADVDTLLYGGTLGADAWIADRWIIGLAAGYARSDVDLHSRDTDVYGDTVQGALYAGFIDPRGFLSAYGRYAYTFQDSSRSIEAGTLARHAHADWDAQDYGAGAEAGVTLVSFRGFALQPIAGVDWLQLTEESYTESDAGSLGLIVDPETLDTTSARFGGRVFGRFDMEDAGILVPELRAFYQHLYGDRERVLEARLSGAPGLTSIGVRGPELPSENLLLGVGWGVLVNERLTVSFDYDAVLGSDRVEHQANIAARVVF